ncbi:unnamed protein product [Phyllotreta striolata]|uniref:RRM domain-containing protein n=1 Tax=Phyllotreta striolata TaxID=444603 RepID=A0A9N9TLC1_PHYSR|nr:unnamed protein product [Phyllotreta striolata]
MVILEDIDKFSAKKKSELYKKLNALREKSGYNITQTNGQRVYAPAPSSGVPAPPRGCEIFVGKLSKYIFEDELVPLFERVGPLYKFRMMLDFSERSRGYAFATYFTVEHAERAIAELNNHQIRPNLFIGVYKSVDNCRLFVGNIPYEVGRDEVFDKLTSLVQGVSDIIMFYDIQKPGLNRGFVFVEFESHRYAAMARRQFSPNNLQIWGKSLYVDWADPLPNVNPDIMAKVTVLYLSNLPPEFDADDIRACVCKKISPQMIRKVYKNSSYAFVHFNNRNSAEFALAKLQGLLITTFDKVFRVNVEWSRPPSYSKKSRWVKPPENFCTSVPPSLRRLVYMKKTSASLNKSTATSSNDTSNNLSPKMASSKSSYSEGSSDNFPLPENYFYRSGAFDSMGSNERMNFQLPVPSFRSEYELF